MKYDELIKDLRICASTFCESCEKCSHSNEHGDCYNKLERSAADAIDELQSQLPKWIPVTERLPEKEKRTYWICTDTGYQCECRWTNNRFGIGESDEWGWSIADVPQYHKVTAWMFLPEPYEPPKEEIC